MDASCIHIFPQKNEHIFFLNVKKIDEVVVLQISIAATASIVTCSFNLVLLKCPHVTANFFFEIGYHPSLCNVTADMTVVSSRLGDASGCLAGCGVLLSQAEHAVDAGLPDKGKDFAYA
jgi:hypothetical protein